MSDAAIFEGLVTVRALPPQGAITVRADLASPVVQAAVTGITGSGFPAQRRVEGLADTQALWMSPDEVMLLVPRAQAAGTAETLAGRLRTEHALVTDVSDARVHFEVQGRDVRDVIAKLAPVDMAPGHLAPGELRRTRFAQVAAGFWLRNESTAQVFCFRSVADYMFDLLSVAADPDAPVGHFRP